MKFSAALRSIGMPQTLGSSGRAVFEKSDRREAGQLSDLGGHVRLVGVAGIERQLDQRRGRERLQAAKAQHARKHLRPVPDRIAHTTLKLAAAQAKLRSDVGDTHSGSIQSSGCSAHQWIRAGPTPLLDRVQQERVRVRAGGQRAKQRIGDVASPHVRSVGICIAQLRCRQSQHDAGRAGAQAHPHEPCARRERRHTKPSVRSSDRQLLP